MFFEVATRERLDSQREGPNLCFCWQAWYGIDISHLAKKPKIDKHRRKIAPTGLRDPAVRQKLDFFALCGASASKLIASARFRTPRGTPKKPPFFTGTLFGTVWVLPGRSRAASGTLRIIPASSLGALITPKTLPGAILGRFWKPRRLPGSDLASIFVTDFQTDFCPLTHRFCQRFAR